MLKLLSFLLSFYSFISLASSASNSKSSKQVRFAEYSEVLGRKEDNARHGCERLQPVDQNPVEVVKAFLDLIDGKWRKLLFLYKIVPEELEDDQAFFLMNYCSKDNPELNSLVKEHAVTMIYDGVMCEELIKEKKTVNEKVNEICKTCKVNFTRLQESLDEWKSPELRDQIFSEVKELTNLGASVRPNVTLPELFNHM